MNKRVFGLLTTIMLVVSLVSLPSYAEQTAGYDTSGRTKVASVKNDTVNPATAFGRLQPTYGVAILQICNSNGTLVYVSDTYPVYPWHGNISCGIGANGVIRSYYVLPDETSTNIYGKLKYGLS